jgi:hypothetical protein
VRILGTVSLRDLSVQNDVEAFDRAAGSLPSVLESLLRDVRPEERAPVDRIFDKATRLDVAALLPHGAVGFWVATEWIFERLRGERSAPSPLHEQWDALVEIQRACPEALWFVIELLAALHSDQTRLARRIVLGLDRRFGDRVPSALHARPAAASMVRGLG